VSGLALTSIAKMKRKRTLIDDSGYPLFITTTIVRWLPIFSDSRLAIESLRLFENLRNKINMSIFGYCLMPSHFHAIMKSTKIGDISIFMRQWKSLSARIIIDHYARRHQEWITQFEENARNYKARDDQHHQVWMP
jgi:putative transposase